MVSSHDVFGADHPEAYIPGDRRRALRDGRGLPDRTRGAALFADISGFTPLTESLVATYGPRRGAEELSAALEVVFGAVLAELHRFGGAVIYFSGDAVTCWLDGDDGTLAVAAGLAMQEAMARSGTLALPDGGTAELGMKVAVAAGPARRYVVGDPAVQLVDVLAGRLMDTLAAVEASTDRGEVVLAAATADALAGRLVTGMRRENPAGDAVVVTGLTAPVDPPPVRERVEGLPESVTRQWLLPAVYERMRAGRGDFLTELRPTVPVFVHFTGIDHDDDPDAPAKLDTFVRAVQHVVDGYGGNLLQLTIGDKGAYLYLVFGAPVAHEDDPARACAAALDLLPLVDTTAAQDLRIGIARGSTRAGTNGHRYRRTFTCLGDATNLAARLMAKAAPGEVYVSEAVAAATGERFGWEPLAPLTLKGKAAPALARSLVAHRRTGAVVHARRDRPMLGRDDVLAEVRQLVQQATIGRGRVVGITGEAGLGKSRLIAEVLSGVDCDHAVVAVGEAQTFGVPTAYSAWRGIVLDLFALAPTADAATQLATFTAAVEALDPALAARAPLLGALTGADLPENDLTAAMTPELRKGSLELLVAQLLQRRSRTTPLVLVLEDAHALDPLAADLLDVVVRRVAALPVLVLLAYRPFDATQVPTWLATLRSSSSHAREVVLGELAGEAAAALVDVTARRVFDLAGAVPDALRRTVLARTQGNPFHIEELVAFVRARGVDVHDAAALAALDLPDSLESLVLSRIDALPEQPRRTAKVASVVGRTFDTATVDAAAPDLERLVEPSVLVLTERDLVVPEAAPADRGVTDWAFRHVVVRDVAYDSLPWAVRAALHDRIGEHLVAVAGSDADSPRVLDLLAHHRWHGRDDDRKRDVLARAGSAARTAGANAVAALHLERLLTLVDDDAAPAVLADLGEAQELSGAWDAARATRTRALDLATAARDRRRAGSARVALADLTRRQGDFAAAAALLEAAEADFGAVDDDAGRGRVLHLRGTIAGQQGRLAEARELYGRSLAIRRRIGDRAAEGSLLANLGMMAEYDGDYPTAIALTEQALAVREEVGDRWAVGHAHSNLGMLLLAVRETDRAIASLTEALRLHREVGDLWMIAIGHENLGVAHLRAGDLAAAAADLATGVEAHRLLDDPWSTAHLLEDVARLAARAGRTAAVPVLVGAADRLRDQIGSPRTESQTAELSADLGPASDDGVGRSRGRATDLPDALTLADEVCSSVTSG